MTWTCPDCEREADTALDRLAHATECDGIMRPVDGRET